MAGIRRRATIVWLAITFAYCAQRWPRATIAATIGAWILGGRDPLARVGEAHADRLRTHPAARADLTPVDALVDKLNDHLIPALPLGVQLADELHDPV